jgi:hypothetical protein
MQFAMVVGLLRQSRELENQIVVSAVRGHKTGLTQPHDMRAG